MSYKWHDCVIKSEFMKLVKDNICPPTEEIKKIRGLYAAILSRYGQMDFFCNELGVRRLFYNHVHFKHNGA